jgi:hypothetical protein
MSIAALGGCILCLVTSLSFAAKPDSVALETFHAAVAGVPGWAEQKDRFRSFGTKQLYDLIDGGAAEYEKPGLVGGVLVVLSGAHNESAQIYIEDFGSAKRALEMVKQKRKTASEPKTLAGAANAFTDEVIGGCVAYASFKGFYFELALTGYESQEKATDDAKVFINALIRRP